MANAIKLIGRSYNKVPYLISILHDESNKVTTIVMSGKPCKAVKDIVDDFKNLRNSNAENVANNVTLAMMNHNEFVSKQRI